MGSQDGDQSQVSLKAKYVLLSGRPLGTIVAIASYNILLALS